ncbi:Lrp/AsnC family transcriptional regulator [Streptomyces sp. NPDC014983]|uniref:Lrp/AsnC family transcriptional regulator n=1 Tax=Streptomyces sp. NPDC014983 TaxID=3364933 RepID=UPI0036FAF787
MEYDHEPLGQGIEALCRPTVAPRGLAAVGRAVAAWPEVRFAAAVGGRVGLAVSVLCRTADDLHPLVGDRLAALPDVTTAETTVTLRRVKSVSRRGA